MVITALTRNPVIHVQKSNIYQFGDVPKWLKGPHSKCGRGVKTRESSNLSISAKALKAHAFKAFSSSAAFDFLTKIMFFKDFLTPPKHKQ